uniref:CSON006173 protein n=1 Tax=Culicoides sonorensis TaxID=179676 RepID=A0A336M119_CULSO
MLTKICVGIVIAQIFRYVIPWLYKNFLGPYFFGKNFNFRKYGEWAIVTGGSAGIGKAFAEKLAQKGMNLILISNVPHELDAVANQIESRFKVKTLVINIDFTKGVGVYDVIKQKIKGLDIGVLVNNVGIGYPGPLQFHELAVHENFFWDIISINLLTIPFMTKLVIHQMLEKNKGLIINISSLDATFPVPVCLYSAIKAYMNKFTEDFNIEYQGKDISMQAINPGAVRTDLWTVECGPWLKPSAKVYVESAFNTIGMGNNTIGYYPHVLLQLFIKGIHFMCPFIYNKLIWLNQKMQKPKLKRR